MHGEAKRRRRRLVALMVLWSGNSVQRETDTRRYSFPSVSIPLISVGQDLASERKRTPYSRRRIREKRRGEA